MTVRKVQIVSLPVSDPARARDFYRDALGFDVIEDQPLGPSMRWLQMGPSGATFSIALVTWFKEMAAGSVRGLMLEVDDVDAMAQDLHDRGFLPSADVREESWGRYVELYDPDGNGLILQTPLA